MPANAIAIAQGDQAKCDAEICTAFKRSMTKAGLTYKSLAEALGHPLHTVWNWANGRASLPARVLPALANVGMDAVLKKTAELAKRGLVPQGDYLRKVHADKPVRAHVLMMAQDFGVVAAEVESALKDGEIDRQESLRIDDALSSMEKKIWALRAKTQSGDRS
jgi:transcriptional regulator with XRE-family HTH domain